MGYSKVMILVIIPLAVMGGEVHVVLVMVMLNDRMVVELNLMLIHLSSLLNVAFLIDMDRL